MRPVITLIARTKHRKFIERVDFDSFVKASAWMREQTSMGRIVRVVERD